MAPVHCVDMPSDLTGMFDYPACSVPVDLLVLHLN